jgi:hypothetical protein
MKHIEGYELFEAAAPINNELIKQRIVKKLDTWFKSQGMHADEFKKWLKETYKIDPQPMIDRIKAIETKAACDQLPNILAGIKGDEFAKYIDEKLNSLIREFVTAQFTTGIAKGKQSFVKTRYMLSGKEGLAKEAFKNYKSNKIGEGQKDLIDSLTGYTYNLGTNISQAIRLDPAGSSDELPEIKAYSDSIRKWEKQYDSYFSNGDKILMTYLNTLTSAIWEA